MDLPKKKLTRAQLARLKKKQRKIRAKQREEEQRQHIEAIQAQDAPTEDDDVEVEYVVADPFANSDTSDYTELKEVFDKLATPESSSQGPGEAVKQAQDAKQEEKKQKLSRRQKKLAKRVNIAVLKQLVARPDLVEMPDTCAAEPFVLLHLKAYHNVVNVPRHWSDRPKYLQGKRGVEKKPFELPEFIKNTGISELRGALLEKDSNSRLKAKTRERVSGATGKMEIDYQTLHDAFFRYQTKPPMTKYGELYYEGKEFEVVMTTKRPGVLSSDLKEALGMEEGQPPPWLVNMQNVGPPPSYPNLQIPGVNAPVPQGAEFGYHPGGWGRPPLDPRTGMPLYHAMEPTPEYVPEQSFWGIPQVEEEPSSEEEESEEEVAAEAPPPPPTTVPPPPSTGTETPLSGLETPQNLEGTLRKRKDDRSLYQVLQETEASVGDAVLGSSHTYLINKNKEKGEEGGAPKVDLMKSRKTESFDIALDPSNMDMTEEQLKKHIAKVAGQEQEKEKTLKRKRPLGDDLDKRKKKKKKDSFKF